MLEFKMSDLDDKDFMSALDKLDNHSGWDSKTTWDFNRIKKAIDDKMKQGQKQIADLVQKYTEKKVEDGVEQMVFEEVDGRKRPKITNQEEFDVAYQEIMDGAFEVKSNGIPTDRIIEAGLTNREIRACERIVSESI